MKPRFYRMILCCALLVSGMAGRAAAQTAVASPTDSLELLSARADSLYAAGLVDSALSTGRRFLQLAEARHDTLPMVSGYSSQGVYLRSSGRTDEAVKAYDKALALCRHLTLDTEEELQTAATLYVNLATLYLDMKDGDKAESYAREAAQTAERCADSLFRSQLFSVAASIFIVRQDHDRALRYLEPAVRLADGLRQYDAALSAQTNYLLVLFRTGRPQAEVEAALRKAESLVPQAQSVMTVIGYLQVRFYLEQTSRRYDSAIRTARRLLQTDGIGQYPFVLYDVYNNLHAVYRDRGDYRNAYETLGKAAALHDSLYRVEQSRQLEELSVKYETQKKELEIERLQEQERETERRLQLWVGASLALLLLLGTAAAYLLQRQKLRNERLRREAEERQHEFEKAQHETEQALTRQYLAQLEEEHTRLARELHDGICNHLFALEMQMQAADVPPQQWLETLRASREDVRRVSHELITPAFSEATLVQVLQHFVRSVSTPSCSVSLSVSPPEAAPLPESLSINIYRIVQEAVANSLKHSGATAVGISLSWELPRLLLRITDNGTAQQPARAGIGLRTMKERAAAMNATFSADFGPEGGRIEVVIPVFS